MTPVDKTPLIVDIGPLRETFYTGIPNVIAEICSRLLREDWLDLYFDVDGRWIDIDTLRKCLVEKSGREMTSDFGRFPAVAAIRDTLRDLGTLDRAVALYTDHRPPAKQCQREGKIVYDLSLILTPECHPPNSVKMYTADFEEQLNNTDILFCISQATARDLAWVYGIEPDRLRVMPLGNTVDLEWPAEIRRRIGDRPIEPFLLILGSMEPRKNAGLVLEWIAQHPEILDRTRIVFAGRNAWGASFAEQVLAKSLTDAVKRGRLVFTGFVDEREKGSLLTGAAALLYPSVFEGFGLPILEAMTVGTPVLASVSSSMPEVVGDCGYYFDPCEVASLHDAFNRFWADRTTGAVAEVTARARTRAGWFGYDAAYKAIIEGLFPNRQKTTPSPF